MPSLQTIKYKSSWHDDYLKWICGFANAQGDEFISVKTIAEWICFVNFFKPMPFFSIKSFIFGVLN